MKILNNKLIASAIAVAFSLVAMSNAQALSRKPQDNLFYANSADPLGLDPALVDDENSARVQYNIYESLLRFKGETSELEPCLATSYEISEDGLEYTFKLREGVKFHDGTPFNAEAVKFNIVRQMPDNIVPKMSYAGLVYGDVERVDVIDEYTVKIVLKKKSTPFIRNLAMVFAAPIASPAALKQYNNNLNMNPVGTGPYQFVAWDKGQQIILTRFEDYWGEPAKIQNLIFRTIPDTSARVIALNNGEVDVIYSIDDKVLPTIEQAGNIVYKKDGLNTTYVALSVNRDAPSVCKDPDVRRAIGMAVDMKTVVDTLYNGTMARASTFLPKFLLGYSEDVKYPQYNPEEAKKIFEAKGVKELKIIANSAPSASNPVGGQLLGEAFQDYLKKVGVNVNIETYEWTTFRAKLLTDQWDITFMGWQGDNGDPDNFLALFASDDPIANTGIWRNADYDKLISKGTEVLDGPERGQIYTDAEKIMAAEAGILPLGHGQTLLGVRPNIKGLYVDTIGCIPFSKIVKE